jgi:ubiquinone/menaquinone biosynthesis C-methylase UbiE
MAEATIVFDDGAAYERYMGRWSRAAGAVFLDWVAPPKDVRWLDVGCGTGVFTQLVLDTCSPAALTAVDPSAAQIDQARKQPVARQADFRVADAQALPFPEASFDVVASALVINFIPDRPRALAEMRRVGCPGATVAGYVWDFAAQRGPSFPMLRGLSEIGAEPPLLPGAADSTLAALRALFERAGFEEIANRPIEVTQTFRDFDDFWQAQTPSFHPVTKTIAALPDTNRRKLIEAVQAGLPSGADGRIAYSVRANAIKARVPR